MSIKNEKEIDEGTEENPSGDTDFTEISVGESRARSSGWVPEDEWERPPEEWIDWAEFNRRGELLNRISTQTNLIDRQRSEIASVKEALKELGEHHKKVAELERKRVISELKKQKREALSDDDIDKADKLDEEIEEVRNAPAGPDIEKATATPEPVERFTDAEAKSVQTWVEENSDWYLNDLTLQSLADTMFDNLMARAPDMSVNERLAKVKTTLESDFPEKFGMAPTKRANKVSGKSTTGGKSSGNGKSRFTVKHLNPQQRKFAKDFVEGGAFKTEQEYVDQLADMGELEAQQ